MPPTIHCVGRRYGAIWVLIDFSINLWEKFATFKSIVCCYVYYIFVGILSDSKPEGYELSLYVCLRWVNFSIDVHSVVFVFVRFAVSGINTTQPIH